MGGWTVDSRLACRRDRSDNKFTRVREVGGKTGEVCVAEEAMRPSGILIREREMRFGASLYRPARNNCG